MVSRCCQMASYGHVHIWRRILSPCWALLCCHRHWDALLARFALLALHAASVTTPVHVCCCACCACLKSKEGLWCQVWGAFDYPLCVCACLAGILVQACASDPATGRQHMRPMLIGSAGCILQPQVFLRKSELMLVLQVYLFR